MTAPLHSLWKHFSNKRTQVIEASVYSILNKLFDIAPPILIGMAVDTVVKKDQSFIAQLGFDKNEHQLMILGGLTFLIWALESFFEYLYQIRWRNLAQEVQHALRIEAYAHLQKLHLSFFEDQNTGNLTTIINDDVNQLERFLDIGANQVLQVLTTVISIGAIFFYISPTIAFLSFTPIPIILWGSFYFQKTIAPKYLKAREEAGILASMLTNNLGGMPTIKSFVAQEYEKNRLEKQSLRYAAANEKAIRISSSFSPLIRIVILVGFLFSLILGGFYTLDGRLEIGSYSILIFLVQRLLWPLTRLADVFDLYQRAMASSKRVLNLIQTPIRINDGHKPVSQENFKGEVQFFNMSFKYDTGPKILNSINLHIPAGKTIAIVGSTGSGKSTLLKLLLRFYDVSEGDIFIDGEKISDLEQDELRKRIGLVSQDTYLFHGSVHDNISYGSFKSSKEEVISAAKMAEAHDFILSLPEGYQTIVGERGQKLSGGQRQRICIARALIKDPHLFIFDEATSAVDNETEAAIARSLNNITQNRTTIMVAHRLSTIKNADKIYVLESGCIQEEGTHSQLLENKKLYHALWNVQTGLSQ